MIIKQTMKQKDIAFWKIILLSLGVIALINSALGLLRNLSPIMSSFMGLIIILGASIACIRIIYRRLAYYNYSIIEDELVMERVLGRANHMFLSLKLSELELFVPYLELQDKGQSSNKVYRFVAGSNKAKWYVGEFTRAGDRYRFFIEPNEELLKAIMHYKLK